MQYIFVPATKQHLFSARLSRYTQPNMTALHVLSLSHVSLGLRYELGSTATRTKQALRSYTAFVRCSCARKEGASWSGEGLSARSQAPARRSSLWRGILGR